MIEHPYRVDGEATTTYVVESPADFCRFRTWTADLSPDTVLGLDTETTGLAIYSEGFACRLVQVGTPTEAFVIPAQEYHGALVEWFAHQIDRGRRFVAHNAAFDVLVLDHVGIAPQLALGDVVFDTRILAHLLDPRSAQEGGTGLGLKALSGIYVDPSAPDTAAGLDAVFRKEYGATKKSGQGWSLIDLFHPTYNLYAGLDVILVTRLLKVLSRMIRALGLGELAAWEHKVALSAMKMQRRGLRVDVDYTTGLVSQLAEEEAKYLDVAAGYGVANVNSTKQVTEGLQGTGEVWTATTPSGALAVGKEVLLGLADLDGQWQPRGTRTPNPLAVAILRAKRAAKWSTAYALPFLTDADRNGRIHASINPLAARTARMSISSPPLQQLPSSDWTIRRAIIPDDGMVLISADFSSVELRVLAALADVRLMKAAIDAGDDLHTSTARLIYGEEFEAADAGQRARYRKFAKTVGLGKVYGGGIAGLSRQTGLPVEGVRRAVEGYDAAYPEVADYGRRLQRRALLNRGFLVTPSGRMLPMDRERAYSATNHVVQSTARDLMAAAMLRAEETALADGLLLPIHDQLLAQVPAQDAEEAVRVLQTAMTTSLAGVPIDSDAEVVGDNWGLAYKGPSRFS